MKNMIRSLFVFVALLTVPADSHGADRFSLGIAPHTSARVILQMYQPLRLHLEKSLGMSVEVVTATDFNEYARRAIKQEYDLAVTTGHQARLLQTDAKYLPLLTYKADFKAVALILANGVVKEAKDLAGKNALGLSPASLVTLWGQHWLVDNGLGAVQLRYVSASDSVAQLIIAGEAAAGFTSLANFQMLNPEVRGQLRILAESKSMAGRVYVLNGRRSAVRKKIETALWDFARSDEGIRYFETHKLGGYRQVAEGELKQMDRYAVEVRNVLSKDGK
jgi:phosphonate transport system substrate-binding protein